MLLNPDNAGAGNAHVINQSLKPKMIMNNNSIPLQPGKVGGMHQINSSQFQQHQAHAGDIVQMGASGNSHPRPASSKVQKKKSTIGSQGNIIAHQQQNLGSKNVFGSHMMNPQHQ